MKTFSAKPETECDGLSGYRALPGVVLLPDTVDAVQKILALCQRYQREASFVRAGQGLVIDRRGTRAGHQSIETS